MVCVLTGKQNHGETDSSAFLYWGLKKGKNYDSVSEVSVILSLSVLTHSILVTSGEEDESVRKVQSQNFNGGSKRRKKTCVEDNFWQAVRFLVQTDWLMLIADSFSSLLITTVKNSGE